MKRYSTLLITRKFHSKITMKYHITLVRIPIIRKSTDREQS